VPNRIGTVPQGFDDCTAGRKNGCDRRNCSRRCFRLNRLNRCTRPEGLSLKASATIRRGGRIGAAAATACVVVFACTGSTTAIVPRDCPSRLRRPSGRAEELVRPAQLLASLFSLEPTQPLQSSRGSVPRAFGDRTAGRKNWCDRCKCWRRCFRLSRFHRCSCSEGLSPLDSGGRAVGRQNWSDRCKCRRRCFLSESLPPLQLFGVSVPARLRRPCGGSVELERPVQVPAAVFSSESLPPLQLFGGSVPARLRRPCCGSVELVRPVHLLAAVFSSESLPPLQLFGGSVPARLWRPCGGSAELVRRYFC
jgi:hypothetical protein